MVHPIDGTARHFPLTPVELLTHRDWVRRFCAGLVGESNADDVAQDTWIAAVRRGRSGQSRTRAWLASVARSVALAPLTWPTARPLRHAGWAAASVALLSAAAFQLADPVGTPSATIATPVDAPGLQTGQEKNPLAAPATEETQRTSAAVSAPESKSGERPLVAPRVRWTRPGGQSGPPIVVGDRIVHTGKGIALLSADSGEVAWERTAEEFGRWLTVTAVSDELLVAQHASGGYAAFRQKDGTVAWSRSREELGASFHHGGSVSKAEGLFVLPTTSGLAALRTGDGAIVWTSDLGAAAEDRPAVVGGRAIAATPSGTVAAVRLRDAVPARRRRLDRVGAHGARARSRDGSVPRRPLRAHGNEPGRSPEGPRRPDRLREPRRAPVRASRERPPTALAHRPARRGTGVGMDRRPRPHLRLVLHSDEEIAFAEADGLNGEDPDARWRVQPFENGHAVYPSHAVRGMPEVASLYLERDALREQLGADVVGCFVAEPTAR
ncbi:MAG: PQQ-binding-like beta-propeller repeat protein [Planctomycetota bacterium]